MNTPSIPRIVSDVENEYHLEHGTLLGRDRHKAIAEARQLAGYLARTIPLARRTRTFAEIALEMNRTYSTLIHSTQLIERRLVKDTTLQETEARIRAGLCDAEM